MRLSHKYRYIFYSNPKTGSESVRALLTPVSDVSPVIFTRRTLENPFYSHIRPVEVRDICALWQWSFPEYFGFTCVRNPWDRAVSLYTMIKRLDRAMGMSFAEWLQTIETHGPGGGGDPSSRWRMYGTYSLGSYVSDESGNRLVQAVLRMEDLNRELMPLLRDRGIPVEGSVPHINKSKRGQYRDYFDPDSRDLVRRLYREDIEEFRYSY
jgi:hypothetical protein